jgi:hypothetical protein
MDQGKEFASQFRYEEGVLVFRHRGRGAAVPVLDHEVAALCEAHDARRAAGNRVIGYLMLISLLTVVTGIYFAASPLLQWLPYPYALEPIIALVGLGVTMFAVDHWSYGVTQDLRRRPPIGRPLGHSGAWARRMEDLPWSEHGQGWGMLAIIAPLGLFAADLQTANGLGVLAILSAATLAMALASLVKYLHSKEQSGKAPPERRRRF